MTDEKPLWVTAPLACGGYLLVLGTAMLAATVARIACQTVLPKRSPPKNLDNLFADPDRYTEPVDHYDPHERGR